MPRIPGVLCFKWSMDITELSGKSKSREFFLRIIKVSIVVLNIYLIKNQFWGLFTFETSGYTFHQALHLTCP